VDKLKTIGYSVLIFELSGTGGEGLWHAIVYVSGLFLLLTIQVSGPLCSVGVADFGWFIFGSRGWVVVVVFFSFRFCTL